MLCYRNLEEDIFNYFGGGGGVSVNGSFLEEIFELKDEQEVGKWIWSEQNKFMSFMFRIFYFIIW